MPLITKTTLLYLLIALIVFGLGGYLTYQVLKQEIARETDFELVHNFSLIEQAIAAGKPIDALENEYVSIRKVSAIQQRDTNYQFSDTLAMHYYLKKLEPYRQLKVSREINGSYYQVQMIDNFLELDDMFDGVLSVMSRLFITLGSVLLLCSFLISHWLFRPFKRTLAQIKSFNLKRESPLQFEETSIKEFQQLNEFVSNMTSRANQDYQSLKEFSENAAHEMQTPLAIAKGKLELLMGHTDLPSEQLQLVEDAQLSLSKLSRLGQSLTLLTKIDNEEFASQERTNFSEVVATNVRNFKEISSFKGLDFTSELREGIQLKINPALADILVGNLLKNAIRHNVEDGWIKVRLEDKCLVVENAGLPPKVPTAQLFERFRKSNQSGSSLGLGLAIVKKICEVSAFEIDYQYKDAIHRLVVGF